MLMQDLIRTADSKLSLGLAVAIYNVCSVTYVKLVNIMLPFYILYSRRAVAFLVKQGPFDYL